MSKLKKIAKAAQRPAGVPSSDEPREELKKLVKQHKALTKAAVAIDNMARDKKNRATGEAIKCLLPEDAQVELRMAAKAQRDKSSALESAMLRQLRLIPIYKHFLQEVYGVGPVVAAYLVAEIDIRIAEKPSQLRRYCGLAVINGRLERPSKGVKLGYNAEMRMRLYQAFSAMWKNAAKNGHWVSEDKIPDGVDPTFLESRENAKTGRWQYKIVSEDSPLGVTSKYLKIWYDYKHRMAHSARFNAEKNLLSEWADESENEAGDASEETREDARAHERKGARAIIHATGWHKAADILLLDLYLIWRALEVLPVRGSYASGKLGYEHQGAPNWDAPKLITVDEAKAFVGHVGAEPVMAEAAE